MTINQLKEYYEKLAEKRWPDASTRDVELTIIVRDFGMHQYKVTFYAMRFFDGKPIYNVEVHAKAFGGLRVLRKKVNIAIQYHPDAFISDFTEDQEVEIQGFVPVEINELRKNAIAILKSTNQ